MASGTVVFIGQTNPGTSGKAATPSRDAKVTHGLSKNGIPKTSVDSLYKGKPGEFQRRFYDYKRNASLDIDFTHHNNPSLHSNPHLHIWDSSGRGNQFNLWYLE